MKWAAGSVHLEWIYYTVITLGRFFGTKTNWFRHQLLLLGRLNWSRKLNQTKWSFFTSSFRLFKEVWNGTPLISGFNLLPKLGNKIKSFMEHCFLNTWSALLSLIQWFNYKLDTKINKISMEIPEIPIYRQTTPQIPGRPASHTDWTDTWPKQTVCILIKFAYNESVTLWIWVY